MSLLRSGAAGLVVLSLLAGCTAARQNIEPDTGTVGLFIIGILTADIDRSLAFYQRLGLDVPGSTTEDSYRLATGDGRVLFWETASVVNTFDETWVLPPPADRRIVLEFGFDTADDLASTYDALVAAGAPSRISPFDLGAGIEYAVVEDPDGNQISLRYPPSDAR